VGVPEKAVKGSATIRVELESSTGKKGVTTDIEVTIE
jgi:hypothetical protein